MTVETGRKFGLWVIGLLVASTLLGLALVRPPEPVYGGKTISQWLDGGYEQTSLALQEAGPAAAPYIFKKLRAEHPVYGYWSQYAKWLQKAPAGLRAILPKPRTTNFDDFRACQALLELGPGAVPMLTAGLRDPNPAVQMASAWALGLLCDRGVNVQAAAGALTRLARSPEPNVRQRATSALGRVSGATSSARAASSK